MASMKLSFLLSPEGKPLYDRYLTYLKLGSYPHVAARSIGIGARALSNWLAKGQVAKSGQYRKLFDDTMNAIGEASALTEAKLRESNPVAWLKTGPRRLLGDEWRDEPQQTQTLRIEGYGNTVSSGGDELTEDEIREERKAVLSSLQELRKAGIDINVLIDKSLNNDALLTFNDDIDHNDLERRNYPPDSLAQESAVIGTLESPVIPQFQLRPTDWSNPMAESDNNGPSASPNRDGLETDNGQSARKPQQPSNGHLRDSPRSDNGPHDGGTPVAFGDQSSTSTSTSTRPKVSRVGTPDGTGLRSSDGSIQGYDSSSRKSNTPRTPNTLEERTEVVAKVAVGPTGELVVEWPLCPTCYEDNWLAQGESAICNHCYLEVVDPALAAIREGFEASMQIDSPTENPYTIEDTANYVGWLAGFQLGIRKVNPTNPKANPTNEKVNPTNERVGTPLAPLAKDGELTKSSNPVTLKPDVGVDSLSSNNTTSSSPEHLDSKEDYVFSLKDTEGHDTSVASGIHSVSAERTHNPHSESSPTNTRKSKTPSATIQDCCSKCGSEKVRKTRSGSVVCARCGYAKTLHAKSTEGMALPESIRNEHRKLLE